MQILNRAFKLVHIVFVLGSLSCVGQSDDFTYIPLKNEKCVFVEKELNGYKNVSEYLPKEIVKDGSVDYTDYIQKAIDENANIAFPDFPIMINDNGLKLKSNSNIYFQQHSSLIMKPSSKTKFSFFYLIDIHNVEIFNPRLIGERDNHIGEKGEWGMGIYIYGSSDITIYNVDIKNTWGDGIYISSQKDKQSNNITVKDGYIDNARRNGISIISGKNITIDNLLVSNTNGTRPAAGIDIEPNHRTDTLENIVLKNIKTFNNQNEGILLVLTRIGSPDFNKEVSITITDHIDDGSNYAMRFGSGFRKDDKPLAGKIAIENSKWTNFRNKEFIKITGNLNNLPRVEFKSITVEKNGKIDFASHFKKIQKNNKPFNIIEN